MKMQINRPGKIGADASRLLVCTRGSPWQSQSHFCVLLRALVPNWLPQGLDAEALINMGKSGHEDAPSVLM
jgi:hypothetical protein